MPLMTKPSGEASDAVESFISRWETADNAFNQYVFDRAITRRKADGSTTTVWADLYKRGCFINICSAGYCSP